MGVAGGSHCQERSWQEESQVQRQLGDLFFPFSIELVWTAHLFLVRFMLMILDALMIMTSPFSFTLYSLVPNYLDNTWCI